MRISLIGLGNMGLPMARNLMGVGHHLTVFSSIPDRADALVAQGAREASSIAVAKGVPGVIVSGSSIMPS